MEFKLWRDAVTRSRWFRVALDVAVIVLLNIINAVIRVRQATGLVVYRGFFCEDRSIRLPDREEIVPTWALLLGALGIPLATLIVGNIYEYYLYGRDRQTPSVPVCRCRILPWILRLGYQLRWFLMGFVVTNLITDIGKSTVGELRPNFIDVCDPDFAQINCTDEFGQPVYITEYHCRGDATPSRLSWPSGHASLSAFCFVFVALYVTSMRAYYPRSGVRLLLVFFAFVLTLLTCVSRIFDHHHHPGDVISGLILGVLVAAVIVFYHMQYFSHCKGGSSSASERFRPQGRKTAAQDTELTNITTEVEYENTDAEAGMEYGSTPTETAD